MTPSDASEAERIDRIATLERLKWAAAAAQARETVAFKQARTAAEGSTGPKIGQVRRSVGAEVAACRRGTDSVAVVVAVVGRGRQPRIATIVPLTRLLSSG